MWTSRIKYVFLLPAVISLIVVVVIPGFMTLVDSLTPTKSGSGLFYNYRMLVQDQTFLTAFKNTLLFVVGTVVGHLALGLAVALALNSAVKGKSILRVLMILPWTIPDVITGIIWAYIYHPMSGFLNAVLLKLGVIGTNVAWLGDPSLALPSVIMADIWRGYPYVMLVLLAGLQAIPKELYEAARVDGASIFREFTSITIPNLRRVAFIAIALDTIWQFRRYGLIMSMTAGGPGRATEIMSTWVYKTYFQYFKPNYAAAMAIIAALVLIIFAIPYVREVARD